METRLISTSRRQDRTALSLAGVHDSPPEVYRAPPWTMADANRSSPVSIAFVEPSCGAGGGKEVAFIVMLFCLKIVELGRPEMVITPVAAVPGFSLNAT